MSDATAERVPAMPESLAMSSCSRQRPSMFSDGLWASSFFSALQHPMPLLEIQLVVVFLLHYLLHHLHTRFRTPWLVIHGLVGIILGYLLRQSPKLSEIALNDDAEIVITTITSLGYSIFSFLTGVKMNPTMVIKSGKQAWSMGLFSIFFPLLFCMTFYNYFFQNFSVESFRFFAFSQSLTSFPVIACLLTDLKIFNSELGRLASSSALISFLASNSLFLIFIFMNLFANISPLVGFKTLLICGGFIGSITFLARPLLCWIIKHTSEGQPVRSSYIILVTVLAVLSAVISDFVGLEYMLGPFIFGLTVPDGPPLGSTLTERLDTVVSGMVVPLFMTYGGYRTNLFLHFDGKMVLGLVGIVVLSLLGRIAAGLLTAKWFNLPLKDCLALSIILSAKGIVEFSLYITANDKKQMDDAFMTVALFSVVLTAEIVPFVVGFLYDPSRKYTGYQKRSILHTEKNSEMKIVTPVMRQDDALAALKLLEAYNSSEENPISLYVLNLVELVGRSTPLFIDHQQGQKVSKHSTSSGPRTQNIIDIFSHFARKNSRSANVQIFTAVSSYMFMHDDISSLAFSKMASLIVLPFHRKWSNKGKLILDDTSLRSINCHMIERAPCSVGILVDRRKVSDSSPSMTLNPFFRVAMIFIGGDDDREGLVLGKRMARSMHVQLTVIRLVSPDAYEDRWDQLLDAETLKEVKIRSLENGNVAYWEETVIEGPQTASLIRSVEKQFELIIVGRRHKMDSPFVSGLTEWNEFPELGSLGDLLASSDIKSSVSALVIQQQQCD